MAAMAAVAAEKAMRLWEPTSAAMATVGEVTEVAEAEMSSRRRTGLEVTVTAEAVTVTAEAVTAAAKPSGLPVAVMATAEVATEVASHPRPKTRTARPE